MKKVCNEKVTNIVFVCLGFVNLLSFFLLPFYGPVEVGDAPSPLFFVVMVFSNQNIFDLETILPTGIFLVFLLLSFFMIFYGLIRFFHIGKRPPKYSLSSNKNPFFMLSLVLFTISLFAIPAVYANASMSNQLLQNIPSFYTWKVGFGVYTIFPLNAVVSLLYIIFVTTQPKTHS